MGKVIEKNVQETIIYAYDLQQKLSFLKEEYGDKAKRIEKELKECKAGILKHGKENDLTKMEAVMGDKTTILADIKPSSKGVIDVKAFTRFCKDENKQEVFFDCISVGLAKACDNFGEKVLQQHEILKTEVKKFGRVIIGVLK